MAVKFDHILAGRTRRLGEQQDQSLVDHIASRRIAQFTDRGISRGRQFSTEQRPRRMRARTADPDDRDRRRWPPARQREDGVVGQASSGAITGATW